MRKRIPIASLSTLYLCLVKTFLIIRNTIAANKDFFATDFEWTRTKATRDDD